MATILLVDDEPQVTESLSLGLRRETYDVLTANSAQEALEILEKQPIEVVVSDEQMPSMSGSEFLSIVHDRWPATIRLILTGQASMDAAIRAINEAQIFRFLTKPCRAKDLRNTLAAALEAYDAAASAAETTTANGAGAAEDGASLNARFRAMMDSLWMAYQPIVPASSPGIYGYEALVRVDGASPPELFQIAGELGRVAELEEEIWTVIARDLRNLDERLSCFVNLSPQAMNDSQIFSEDHPLIRFADRIVLEISENARLDSIAGLEDKLECLRELGYRIAIDDLGAGHAGLMSFAHLNPDMVKLDRALVADIEPSSTRATLVGSMARLCHELRIDCLAEGIETKEELRIVTDLGCNLIQGYLTGRPGKPFPGRETG